MSLIDIIVNLIVGVIFLFIGNRLPTWGKLKIKIENFEIYPYKAYQNDRGEYLEKIVFVLPPPHAYINIKLNLLNYSGIQKSIRSVDILFYTPDKARLILKKNVVDKIITVEPHNPLIHEVKQIRLDDREVSDLFSFGINEISFYLQYYEMEKLKTAQIKKVKLLN